MDKWVKFVEEKEIKMVKKDQWETFWELNEVTKGDFKNFEDDGSWNSMIDDFAEWLKTN